MTGKTEDYDKKMDIIKDVLAMEPSEELLNSMITCIHGVMNGAVTKHILLAYMQRTAKAIKISVAQAEDQKGMVAANLPKTPFDANRIALDMYSKNEPYHMDDRYGKYYKTDDDGIPVRIYFHFLDAKPNFPTVTKVQDFA